MFDIYQIQIVSIVFTSEGSNISKSEKKLVWKVWKLNWNGCSSEMVCCLLMKTEKVYGIDDLNIMLTISMIIIQILNLEFEVFVTVYNLVTYVLSVRISAVRPKYADGFFEW